MSILALTSNTLAETAGAGQIEYDDQFFATDSNASRGQLERITQGTAVASTSGTSIDFTGIPSWAKRITVMFSGVSTNGSSVVQVKLGSGTIATTGYFGTNLNTTVTALAVTNINNGSGFITDNAGAASYIRHGVMTFMLLTGNTFTMTGSIGYSESSRANFQAGSIALDGTLDRIRITTVNGTDTFDAGSINIMYEG